MPSLVETIRQLHKIDSKLDAGQVIRAYREIGKLISLFEKSKQDIIRDSKSNTDMSDSLDQMQNLEEIIRHLHKINSLIYAGQIVQAYGCNNKLIASFKRIANELAVKESKGINNEK